MRRIVVAIGVGTLAALMIAFMLTEWFEVAIKRVVIGVITFLGTLRWERNTFLEKLKRRRHWESALAVFKAVRTASTSSSDYIRPTELVLESKIIGGAAIFPCRIIRQRLDMDA
jgi:hypothetical protein